MSSSTEAKSTFRAWTFTTPPFPTSLKIIDISPPEEALSPTQLLVEVHAAAINPVDVQLQNSGLFKLSALSYQKGLGGDFAGKVIAKGSEVPFELQSHVFGLSFFPLGKPLSGTLAEVLLVDTKTCVVLPKPANLSFAEAASLPLVYLTAATALAEPYTHFPPTDTTPTIVVLGGSSGVGIYAVQHAVKHLKAKVIATCSGKNSEFVKSLGAAVTIDYTTESVKDRLKALRPPEGYLTIVDCVGGTELFDDSLFASLVTPRSKTFKNGGGYITIVGDKTSRSAMGGSVLYWTHPKMVLRGVWGWLGWGPRYSCIMLDKDAEKLKVAVQLSEASELEIPIDSTWKFEELEQAYDKLNTGRAKGKIVVQVREE
ncbi:zinc alcohol dehydrogenase [Pseudohyphozyma bogoriensis]|nr:zinc alcohol dehydrogenase [Pseudohyphozyma bogoriensis]